MKIWDQSNIIQTKSCKRAWTLCAFLWPHNPCCHQGAGFGFFHDIAMTENYYIALENPISMDFSTLLLRYMTGRACLAECLKYDPSKRTKIHLIPRPGRSGKLFHLTLLWE